ncbi:MAG: heme-binding beta-barrel domain-containing protein [Pyrinomonadaceae bacterium]
MNIRSILGLTIFLVATASTSAQTVVKPDTWKPFKYFVGVWEGTGKGESGDSKVEREYKLTLKDKFLQVTHRSTYAPQEKNPNGEVHDDLGFFSFDKSRKQFVFRQFHVESFVIQYFVSSISEDGKTIILDSESIENVPKGMRSRETWKILNDNEFTETFEIAMPGKEYKVYTENRFNRKM